MMTALKRTLIRSEGTMVQDAIGLAALVVMLFVGLSLPGLV